MHWQPLWIIALISASSLRAAEYEIQQCDILDEFDTVIGQEGQSLREIHVELGMTTNQLGIINGITDGDEILAPGRKIVYISPEDIARARSRLLEQSGQTQNANIRSRYENGIRDLDAGVIGYARNSSHIRWQDVLRLSLEYQPNASEKQTPAPAAPAP